MRILFILSLTFLSFNAQSFSRKVCKVEFDHNSSEFVPGKLMDCLDGYKPEHIRVFGTSSVDGAPLYNMRLSYQRADAVAILLAGMYPGAAIEADGGGINPDLGRQARVVALYKPKAQESVVSNLKEANTTKYRLAADIGISKLDFDFYQSFNFALDQKFENNLSLGIRSSQLATESVLNLHTVYASAVKDFSFSKANLSFGILGGMVRSSIDKKPDVGLELRLATHGSLGFYLAASRTIHFASIGGGLEAHL